MSDTLTRGAPPPPPTKTMEVIRVTSSETTLFVCCSHSIFGQWVHWFGRRSHECRQDKGTCEGCRNNWPVKWKGYLHVTTGLVQDEKFLEITAQCWMQIIEQMPNVDTLRGLRFRLAKTRGGARGRYIVSVLESKADLGKLPVERDPYPVLRMLWAAKKGPANNS